MTLVLTHDDVFSPDTDRPSTITCSSALSNTNTTSVYVVAAAAASHQQAQATKRLRRLSIHELRTTDIFLKRQQQCRHRHTAPRPDQLHGILITENVSSRPALQLTWISLCR